MADTNHMHDRANSKLLLEDKNERLLYDLIGTCPERALDIYKFHQERIETIRTRLWTILAWLAAAQGVLLGFTVKELKVQFWAAGSDQITIEQPLLTVVLAPFGMFLASYMLRIVDDGSRHIESNWRRADIALNHPEPHMVEEDAGQRRRKHPVCSVMAWVANLTWYAQFILLILAALVIVESFPN